MTRQKLTFSIRTVLVAAGMGVCFTFASCGGGSTGDQVTTKDSSTQTTSAEPKPTASDTNSTSHDSTAPSSRMQDVDTTKTVKNPG